MSDATQPVVKMYTTSWCPDCHATKAALTKRGIAYQEINIEQDEAAAEIVMQVNAGRRSVPTLEFNGKAASLSRFSLQKLDAYLKEAGLA